MIKVRDMCLDVGGFTLKNISLEVEKGEYYIILGPTGAGKTLLLESIAGLYEINSGEVWLDGKNVTGLEPESRRISIVYQDHALFPHFSVADNIAFGLKMRGQTTREIKPKLERIVGLLNIDHLLKRRPDTLSGGEKQKVALARAIVTDPEVLLLDEPLGALDPDTRENVQEELVRLHSELDITVMHVTHDFEEAIAMGNRVAVIGEGLLKQEGTPEEVFRHPNSEFVARFVMTRNIFPGHSSREPGGKTIFKFQGTELMSDMVIEGECCATIRPEDIMISSEAAAPDEKNRLKATVTRTVNKGPVYYVTASLPPEITAMATRHQFTQTGIETGKQVYLNIPPSSVHLFRG